MTRSPLSVYIIAGEPSGDQLGALLMSALRVEATGPVDFYGVGGERMAAEGLASVVPMADLAVMGLIEVLPNARRLMRHLATVLADIERIQPDVLVTIDSWGFTGRVQRALAKKDTPMVRVHYVAPMVWIWKEGRARGVAEAVDHLLTLWPFEPAFFQRHGLPATHVGHAVIETTAGQGDGAAFRARHGVGPEDQVLLVLPGSRKRELKALMGVFGETVTDLARTRPHLRVVIPTLKHLHRRLAKVTGDWPVPVTIVTGPEEKADAFASARAALAASGTVSLELALAGVPHLIAYRVHPVTAFIFRRLMSQGARFANMVNVLLDREAIPEMIQEKATRDALVREMVRLLEDGAARETQRAEMRMAVALLAGPSGAAPSLAAARTILELVRNRP